MVEGANGRKNAHSAGAAEKQIIINSGWFKFWGSLLAYAKRYQLIDASFAF